MGDIRWAPWMFRKCVRNWMKEQQKEKKEKKENETGEGTSAATRNFTCCSGSSFPSFIFLLFFLFFLLLFHPVPHAFAEHPWGTSVGPHPRIRSRTSHATSTGSSPESGRSGVDHTQHTVLRVLSLFLTHHTKVIVWAFSTFVTNANYRTLAHIADNTRMRCSFHFISGCFL